MEQRHWACPPTGGMVHPRRVEVRMAPSGPETEVEEEALAGDAVVGSFCLQGILLQDKTKICICWLQWRTRKFLEGVLDLVSMNFQTFM